MSNQHIRRVFVDVGGFHGTAALAALDPIFGFDVVYCFEPVPFLADRKRTRISSQRLVVLQKALSDRAGKQSLYNAGSLAGSLFAEAPPYGESVGTITIETADAATFFRKNISRSDFVRVKFNCEGAETKIIESLDATGMLWVLDGSLIDFDSEKMQSLVGKADFCRSILKSNSIKFYEPPEVQYGMVTSYGGVRNWLLASGAETNEFLSGVRSIIYNSRMLLESDVSGYQKLLIKRALGLVR